MEEKFVWLTNHGQRIAGMLHIPEGRGPYPAVLMLHGFTGNRIEAHFLFVKMARRLASAGYLAMRFDFRGSGESEGAFKDVTLPAELDDARTVLAWLRKQPQVAPNQITLLGISMGGAIAAALAGSDPSIAGLILWSAAADPEELFTMKRKFADKIPPPLGVQPDGTFDIGGTLIGQGYVATISEVKPLESVRKFSGPVLILHGTRDASVPPNHADRYLQAIGEQQATRYWIESAGHTYSAHLWEKAVFQHTISWLQKHNPPHKV